MSLPFAHLFFRPNKTIASLSQRHRNVQRNKTIQLVVGASFVFFLGANLIWVTHLLSSHSIENSGVRIHLKRPAGHELRRYPPHRYYKLQDTDQPDFLVKDTEYIFGEWPKLLTSSSGPFKLNVDQSEWISQSPSQPAIKTILPFADGTNPSILTMDRIQQQAPAVYQQILRQHPHTTYIATICMTDSQCSWKDSPEQLRDYHIMPPTQGKPDTVRTLLLFLDDSFQTVGQFTIYLERDAAWGKRMRKAAPGKYHLPSLDDARLFLYQQQIWVSYREGKGFGWETQVLNPIHLDFTKPQSAVATLKASETTSFCCGRNMALLTDTSKKDVLQAVTWVDPVTVITVDTTPLLEQQQQQQRHRRLGRQQKKKTKHKSHIHGTNAFMVPIQNNEEYLGVAHFHRPNDRKSNTYARFGHHYTHAFYTIRTDGTLTGLSPEFVLPSAYDPTDAEIIQFVSGLELANSNQLVLAYGINDCEAAAVVLEATAVLKQWVRPISAGKQVVDFMKPLSKKG